MKEPQMQQVGAWILKVLRSADDEALIASVRSEIAEFARDFPVPGIA